MNIAKTKEASLRNTQKKTNGIVLKPKIGLSRQQKWSYDVFKRKKIATNSLKNEIK